MILGDFQDHTNPRAKIGEIRPHLRPRITFKIGYTPNTLRRDIPTYWDIHFDGRYIGSLQECFTGITSVANPTGSQKTLWWRYSTRLQLRRIPLGTEIRRKPRLQ